MISCFFGLLAAWFSIGYFHLDEHYQILEFLSFKLGTGTAENLPWEHQAQIRPWIQPFFYFLVTKFLNILGIDSPFSLERIFRLISVLLFQISIWKMTSFFIIKYSLEDRLQKFLIWSTALFWVFPFLSARISSEAVGGSLFFIGVIGVLENLDLSNSKKILVKVTLYSILIGLSVWIRFQIGAAVLGFLAWYIFFSEKVNLKKFLSIALGGSIAIFVGILIDYWGYGEFVITPIKYFSRNILEGEAAKHGVTPWWEYFYVSQKKLHPGFGIIVVLSFLYYWIRNLKDALSLPMISFFLMHVLTSHKELRFLYPMANLIPFILVRIISQLNILGRFPGRVLKPLGFLTLGYFLVGSTLSSTRTQFQGIEAIKFLQQEKLERVYFFSGIPFKSLSHNIVQSYYGKNTTEEVSVNNFDEIQEQGSFYVSGRGGKQAIMFKERGCKEVFPKLSSFYFWIHYSRKFHKQDYFSIYKCN